MVIQYSSYLAIVLSSSSNPTYPRAGQPLTLASGGTAKPSDFDLLTCLARPGQFTISSGCAGGGRAKRKRERGVMISSEYLLGSFDEEEEDFSEKEKAKSKCLAKCFDNALRRKCFRRWASLECKVEDLEVDRGVILVTLIRLMRRKKRLAAWNAWVVFVERDRAWIQATPILVDALRKFAHRHWLFGAFRALRCNVWDERMVENANETLRRKLTEITSAHRFLVRSHAILYMVNIFEDCVQRQLRRCMQRWHKFVHQRQNGDNNKLVAAYILHTLFSEANKRWRKTEMARALKKWSNLRDGGVKHRRLAARSIARIFTTAQMRTRNKAFHRIRLWSQCHSERFNMLAGIQQAGSLLDVDIPVPPLPTEGDAQMGLLTLITALAGTLASWEQQEEEDHVCEGVEGLGLGSADYDLKKPVDHPTP